MAIMKFTADVNFLLRGQFRRLLREADFNYSLNLDLQEEKGWFTSTFLVTMEGSTELLTKVKAWISSFET